MHQADRQARQAGQPPQNFAIRCSARFCCTSAVALLCKISALASLARASASARRTCKGVGKEDGCVCGGGAEAAYPRPQDPQHLTHLGILGPPHPTHASTPHARTLAAPAAPSLHPPCSVPPSAAAAPPSPSALPAGLVELPGCGRRAPATRRGRQAGLANGLPTGEPGRQPGRGETRHPWQRLAYRIL